MYVEQYLLFANAHKAWSNSKLGPVTPKTIKGQPDSKDHTIPANDEKIIVSVIPILFLVVSPSTPPNAIKKKYICNFNRGLFRTGSTGSANPWIFQIA